MPELPEVETIKRILQKAIVGKKIVDIEVRKPKIFQGEKKEVIGRKIEAVQRRGKVLIIKLSGNKNLLVHFKLTGQMVWAPLRVPPAKPLATHGRGFAGQVTLDHPIPFAGTELPAKTTHVIFDINGGKLFYNDLRQFGWIKVMSNVKCQMSNELKSLGVEPFSHEFTVEYLTRVFSKTKKPIKLVLMDQTKIAGIGNIYANDALFEAGMSPLKQAKKLSNLEIEKLRKAITKILKDGLKYGGSSARDEAYIKPTGEQGSYQKYFRVYQREGEKCIKCGSSIKRINLAGRGTFFCPKCQQ